MKTSFIVMISLSIFLMLILLQLIIADDYTIDGQSVYVNNSKAYISARPHTLWNSGYVNVEFISKQYTGDINVVFGFNINETKPINIEYYKPTNITTTQHITKKYFNIEQIETTQADCTIGYGSIKRLVTFTNTTNKILCFNNYTQHDSSTYSISWIKNTTITNYWVNYNKSFKTISYLFDNKNLWYYTTNIAIVSNKTYKFRLYLDADFGINNSKYDIAFYPSIYGSNIKQAVQNNHVLLLDPIITTSTIKTHEQNWLSQNAANTVYGSATSFNMQIRRDRLGQTDAANVVWGFNLSSVTGTITNADLYFYIAGCTNTASAENVNFKYSEADYNNNTITWNNQAASLGTQTTVATAPLSNCSIGWYVVDFTTNISASPDKIFSIKAGDIAGEDTPIRRWETNTLYNSVNIPYINVTTSTESTDSCTYSGDNNWDINISHNCTLTTNITLGSNILNITGDNGILTINTTITAKEIHFTPTDFDGDSIIKIDSGGLLSTEK